MNAVIPFASSKPNIASLVLPTFIRKRTRELVDFNADKISGAIEKAVAATGIDIDVDRATYDILQVISTTTQNNNTILTVEEIQDIVEDTLVDYNKSLARAYVKYRTEQTISRANNSTFLTRIVGDYLDQSDWRVNENSNMSLSVQGLHNHISSEVQKQYALEHWYEGKIADAHRSGDLHIHDLGMLATYCVGWDLKSFLLEGFTGVDGKLKCKAPSHFTTALDQTVQFLYTMQGESSGAQAISSLDTLMAPFIRQDGLGYKEVLRAVRSFVFSLNVSTRVGFQTPFTNVTLDLTCPKSMQEEAVVIGGKYHEEWMYGDFQEEMDMFNRAFAEVMGAGDASGQILSFPIPTYNIGPDFDWNNPNYEGIWKMTGKYGIPYFTNYVNSDLDPDDSRSMCCRLRLDLTELRRRSGGLFGSGSLTGSVGVVTINMPRLGYLSNAHGVTEEEKLAFFYDQLDILMCLARDSLVIKRQKIEEMTDGGFYPYCKFYLKDIKARMGSYWKNHFSTIGLIGMHEACINLGFGGIHTEKGKEFATRCLNHMRDMLQMFQASTGDMFNLEATPAEGVSYRLFKADRERYNMVGLGTHYTNSTHLPVNYTSDLFTALEHQSSLQELYTGGTVLHGFIGAEITDIEKVKYLIKTSFENFKLPYLSITPTFSVCKNHGYLTGEQHVCPQCQSDTLVYSRVVGFLRPVRDYNIGKKAEFKDRKVYDVEETIHHTEIKCQCV